MVKITWLGHASFLVEGSSVKLAIDPWVSNPKGVMSVDKLPELDYIVVTHDHGDHLGDTIDIMKRFKKTVFVSIYELANYVGEQVGDHNRVVGANIGGPVKVDRVSIVFTPAIHSATRGSPMGVVVTVDGVSIYHAGDTALFGDMQLIRELYTPKVALLPIGGHFTMGVREAAKAVELLKPEIVIPMHYDTFPLISVDPNEFASEVAKRTQETKVVILKPGESIEV